MNCWIVLLLMSVMVSAGAQAPVRFSAEVRAGEKYVHAIGHGLYFVLDATGAGEWNFEVKRSPDSKDSYTECLGSPNLHGPATVDLSAWRFAAGAEAGWAEKVPVTKGFAFVTTAADHEYECAEYQAVYDSSQRSQSAGQMPNYDGLAHYKARPLGKGRVVIASVALKAGLAGTDAEFERVAMRVSVEFPKRRRVVGR